MVEGGVGTVVTGAGCGGGAVAAILVGVAEMAAKKCEGFGGVLFGAPFSTRNVKKTGCVDYVVSDADDGCFTRCIVAGSGESDAE